MREVVFGALEDASVEASDVDVTHIGNFVGASMTGQAHLGGFMGSLDPAFRGKAAARHEAACASGSIAVMAALAELEAGFHEVACVVGIEEMRSVPGDVAADHLAAAAWRGKEATDARFAWPYLFDQLTAEVQRRFGVEDAHLRAFAKMAYRNARTNPYAQTRTWTTEDGHFSDDDALNPTIEGRVRRYDCGQITDGAACVILASEPFARTWATRRGQDLAAVPRVLGWGHRAGPMTLAEKFEGEGPWLFPHVREAALDARRRAATDLAGIDAIELHDCFSITGYTLLEHLDLTEPGRGFEAIEDGRLERAGAMPVNPSGGLIGLGHPVGATGVRMVADASRQTRGTAEGTQVEGARRVQTLNIGGSATTAVSFVVGV
jgi:acetyl-CoA C-acetyltransferase